MPLRRGVTRYVLLGITLAVAGVTWLINTRITPTYEVNSGLLPSASKVNHSVSQDVNVAASRELLESQSLAAALLEEFKLTDAPYNLTPRKFLADHVSVRLIPATTMLDVSVRLTDPDLLVKVANRNAARIVDLAERLNSGDAEYVRQGIKQELASLKRLNAAEAELAKFQAATQIELLRSDVNAMLMRRPEALDLTVQIDGERARLKQAEAELGKQERVRDLPSAITSVDTLWPPAASGRPVEPSRPGTAAGDKPSSPCINPLYEVLQRGVADARTRLAGLDRTNCYHRVILSADVDVSARKGSTAR